MSKEHVIQDLPFTEQLKEAGIKNVGGGFGDLVDELTDRIGNRDVANRMAQMASGLTLNEIADSWEKNGFRGLTSEAVRNSIRKGLQKLNEKDD